MRDAYPTSSRVACASANSTALSEGSVTFTVSAAWPAYRYYFVMISANCASGKCDTYLSGYIRVRHSLSFCVATVSDPVLA